MEKSSASRITPTHWREEPEEPIGAEKTWEGRLYEGRTFPSLPPEKRLRRNIKRDCGSLTPGTEMRLLGARVEGSESQQGKKGRSAMEQGTSVSGEGICDPVGVPNPTTIGRGGSGKEN